MAGIELHRIRGLLVAAANQACVIPAHRQSRRLHRRESAGAGVVPQEVRRACRSLHVDGVSVGIQAHGGLDVLDVAPSAETAWSSIGSWFCGACVGVGSVGISSCLVVVDSVGP